LNPSSAALELLGEGSKPRDGGRRNGNKDGIEGKPVSASPVGKRCGDDESGRN